MLRSLSASLIISKGSVVTHRAAGMFASRPSIRSSTMWRCMNPLPGRWPSVFWQSRAGVARKKPVDFLTRAESEAVLGTPDQTTWSGRRDRTLLLVALQTGLRVSELIGLRCQDVVLETGAHVRCTGKGRKTRCIPLRKEVVVALRHWLQERNGQAADAVFTNARGQVLSRDGVQYILSQQVIKACETCPSLKTKRVSPHVLRHSTAMDLLQNGVDRSVIALWLGHESMDTTQIYLHASLELKQKALAKTEPFRGRPGRYQPPDQLLAFLQAL